LIYLLCALLLAAPAPTARLVVERAADTDRCARPFAEPSLRSLVAARLGGRDPFVVAAAREARVRFSRSAARFVATIVLTEPDGRQGERRLSDSDCDQLVRAVALALALAVDPLALDAPAKPPRVVRADALASDRRERHAPELQPANVMLSRPAETGPTWRLASSLALELGATPDVAIGPTLRLELGDWRWRAVIEGGLGFAGPTPVADTRVLIVRGTLRVDLCWHQGMRTCLGLTWARSTASADEALAEPISETRDALLLGASIGISLGSHARLELGLGLPLTPRATFVVGEAVAWRAWPVIPSLRLVVLP